MKTVFKLKKIQTLQHLANIGKHCYEISELERDKFEKLKSSVFKKPIWTLIGNSNKLYSDVKNLKNKFNLEKRKNSAVGVEIVLSMSPEFFNCDFDEVIIRERVKDFTNRSIQFVTAKFGRDRIAHAVLHLHETTPHIHILLVPWEEQNKRGRYASAPYRLIKTKYITPHFLSKIQNEYWNLFSDYSLQPLAKKRTGKITSLKDHYINSIEKAQSLEISLSEKEQLISNQKTEISKLNKFINTLISLVRKLMPFSKIEIEEIEENKKQINSDFLSVKRENEIKPSNSIIDKIEIETQDKKPNNNTEKQNTENLDMELPLNARVIYGNKKSYTQEENINFELPIKKVDNPEQIRKKSNKPKFN